MADEKNILLMFSGGKDSFLSAIRLHHEYPEHTIKLVTYDNGCMKGIKNAKSMASRLIESERYVYEYCGPYPTYGISREFFFPYMNMKPSEQEAQYPGLTPSQYHCLICKTSMYLYSIWLAKKWDCEFIADGSRESQEFVIELPGMIQRFKILAKSADLELLHPVYEVDNDWELDNEIMRLGFTPKMYEPKCMIGCPINNSIDTTVVDGVHKYYDMEILPTIKRLGLLQESVYKAYMNTQNFD